MWWMLKRKTIISRGSPYCPPVLPQVVEHVPAVVEVLQVVGFSGAIALKYSNILRNCPQTVSKLSPS
jgi:hypothetical protein